MCHLGRKRVFCDTCVPKCHLLMYPCLLLLVIGYYVPHSPTPSCAPEGGRTAAYQRGGLGEGVMGQLTYVLKESGVARKKGFNLVLE